MKKIGEYSNFITNGLKIQFPATSAVALERVAVQPAAWRRIVIEPHFHHIEPAGNIGVPVQGNVEMGQPCNLALFGRGDGFLGRPGGIVAAGFHLDESQDFFAALIARPGDAVDFTALATPWPPVALDNAIAARE